MQALYAFQIRVPSSQPERRWKKQRANTRSHDKEDGRSNPQQVAPQVTSYMLGEIARATQEDQQNRRILGSSAGFAGKSKTGILRRLTSPAVPVLQAPGCRASER